MAVSSCLLGYNCRYNGKIKKNSSLLTKLESENILPICPEQFGRLSTPRDPSYLIGGDGFDVLDGNAKVVNKYGVDNTKAFIDGAYAALNQIRALNIYYRCHSSTIYPRGNSGRRGHLKKRFTPIDFCCISAFSILMNSQKVKPIKCLVFSILCFV